MKAKTILLTGASGGLGTELIEFLVDDYNIVCQYRKNEDSLRQIFGEKFDDHCFKADLTDEAQVAELKRKTETNFGQVWGVINLAGASTNAMSWKMSLAQFTDAINDNLVSTFLVSREFIPGMRAQNAGRLINISSVIAFTGAVGASHYCAAKAGIVGLTKSLALELANKNITVNALALGYFDRGLIAQVPLAMQEDVRNRTPLKRFGHVNEMAGMIRFLLSDDGAFTTGQVHHINGGIHL